MKNIFYLLTLLITCSFFVVSCDDDKPGGDSIFVDDEIMTDFDIWLDENYRVPYNIAFKYKYMDIEADLTFNLAPATLEESYKIARLVKFLWLDAYEEVTDPDFLPTYVPRIIHLVGSAGWEGTTIRLGTAEGGLKITLYVTNWLDPTDVNLLNEYYFVTIHHEFAHILHQTIDYPTEFNLISVGDYSPGAWFNRTDAEAAVLGFVSNYASSENQEDFVETFARYITMSDEAWAAKLESAGTAGSAKILQKLDIVKQYMIDSWKFDVDELRDVLQRRYQDVPLLDLDIDNL